MLGPRPVRGGHFEGAEIPAQALCSISAVDLVLTGESLHEISTDNGGQVQLLRAASVDRVRPTCSQMALHDSSWQDPTPVRPRSPVDRRLAVVHILPGRQKAECALEGHLARLSGAALTARLLARS